MWSTICAEWPERGPLLEDGHGGRLASDRSLSEADLYQRVVNLKAMLGTVASGLASRTAAGPRSRPTWLATTSVSSVAF